MRATVKDGPESVRLVSIRPTHGPVVLITCGQLSAQLTKVINPRKAGLRPWKWCTGSHLIRVFVLALG
ncbi:hypothetical protein ACWDFR_08320 [Streptomyces sp. 900105755]